MDDNSTESFSDQLARASDRINESDLLNPSEARFDETISLDQPHYLSVELDSLRLHDETISLDQPRYLSVELDSPQLHNETILLEKQPDISSIHMTDSPRLAHDETILLDQPDCIFDATDSVHLKCKVVDSLIKVMREMKPAQRRPYMSILLDSNIGRKNIESLLGSRINWREWKKAREHTRYPGVGNQIEIQPKRHNKKDGDPT